MVYTKRKRTGSANLRKPIPFAAPQDRAQPGDPNLLALRDEAKASAVYRQERRALAFEGMGGGVSNSDAETGRGGELVRAAEARLHSEVGTWSAWSAAAMNVPPPQLRLDVYPLVWHAVTAAVDSGDIRNLTVIDLIHQARHGWYERYQLRVQQWHQGRMNE